MNTPIRYPLHRVAPNRRGRPDARGTAITPLAGAALAALLLVAPGCEPGHPEYFGTVRPKHPPSELWVNNGGEAQWIDPGKCSDSNGGDVIWNTFAGLVEAHPKTLEPMPDIAQDWTLSEDGTQYTFYLRPSRWSDGTELTAHDFEWSWKRLLDPKTASKYAYIAYAITNAEAFNLKALFVSGLPTSTPIEALKTFIEEAAPVKRIDVSADPQGFLVFIGGEDEQLATNRALALQQLNGADFQGHTIEARVADGSLVGVRALDDHTLQVTLNNPIPYFVQLLTFYSFMPVPRHVIERLEAEGINTDLWTRPDHIVSNGAYVLKEWRFRQYMLFEKNAEYWDAASVPTPRVKAYLVDSYNTALNMYATGEIDFPGGNTSLPAEFMEYLQQYKDYHADPYLAAYFYWFNTEAPPLDNLKVRQALSLAVNREDIVKYVTRAGQIANADLVPKGLPGYEGLNRPLFDPERARQLLAEAGYPNGEGMPPITLIYNTSEGHKQVAEAVQQMWKKNLGIHVNIENLEWKVYLKRMEMMDFQVARMGWIGDYQDPYTFLDLLLPASGNNHSNWSDEQFVELLKEANRTQDAAARMELLREAEDFALKNQPVLPIYTYTRTQMIKPYVRGMWGNFLDRHPWKYVWIDDRWYDGVPSEPAVDEPPPIRPRVPPAGKDVGQAPTDTHSAT